LSVVCLTLCGMCEELSHVFFFQAEDGIRDDLVTGVQTCALPIWPVRGRVLRRHRARGHDHVLAVSVHDGLAGANDHVTPGLERRSEERRVGKECRSPW